MHHNLISLSRTVSSIVQRTHKAAQPLKKSAAHILQNGLCFCSRRASPFFSWEILISSAERDNASLARSHQPFVPLMAKTQERKLFKARAPPSATLHQRPGGGRTHTASALWVQNVVQNKMNKHTQHSS